MAALQTKEIVLDSEGIDSASEAVATFLENDTKLDRRSVLSARLTFENALIRMQEHFGDDTPVTLSAGNLLGKPILMVRMRGERFDPRDEVGQTEWERSLMEAAGLRPTYAYLGGYNVISISCPRAPMGSTAHAAIAIVLGVIISRVGMYFPESTREMLLEGLVTPLFDTFTGMLSGIVGPMVFFSVAWGICGMGDMAALGRSGKVLIKRFLLADVAGAVVAMLVGIPVFHLQVSTAIGEISGLGSVTELLLGILPTNMVQPFVTGNTLQIISLSVFVGVAALALGDLTEGVRQLLRQLNVLMQFLMEQLCRLLPLFIVVMMVSQTWSGTLGALLSCWFPVLIVGIAVVLLLTGLYVLTSLTSRVPIPTLVRACIPAHVIAFTTASASAAFGTMVSTCKDDLGVDDDQVSFGVPLGLVMCKCSMAIMIFIMMIYSAKVYGVGADVMWYVRLGITAFLYAIAVPPVPGGMLACYSIILTNMGIPLDALAVVTAVDLMIDNLLASSNVGALILTVFSSAHKLDAVDKDKLAKLQRQ